MNRLPNDVILHISGYYGEKIPNDLSKQINDQRLLYMIKEKEYYNRTLRLWKIGDLIKKLEMNRNAIQKFVQMHKNKSWEDWNKIVNKIWWSYTLEERTDFFKKNCNFAEPMFITGAAFIDHLKSSA
uniref:Uncharacterized protein n=1 Tax=viral metagenome TaxID=1070528 RepID=A0A6C0LD35_9ZZZZ